MQEAIDKKLVSKHTLVPTMELVPQMEYGNVRPLDKAFVAVLKQSMLRKPTAAYVPLVVNVVTPHSADQIINSMESYKFEVIGRNHSRQAVQDILKTMTTHPRFQTRLCKIYKNLSKEECDWVCGFILFYLHLITHIAH